MSNIIKSIPSRDKEMRESSQSENESSDEEQELFCPLCVEEIDLADKNFLPCPCGYRVSNIYDYIFSIYCILCLLYSVLYIHIFAICSIAFIIVSIEDINSLYYE